jgi:hypothetical protein
MQPDAGRLEKAVAIGMRTTAGLTSVHLPAGGGKLETAVATGMQTIQEEISALHPGALEAVDIRVQTRVDLVIARRYSKRKTLLS